MFQETNQDLFVAAAAHLLTVLAPAAIVLLAADLLALTPEVLSEALAARPALDSVDRKPL